MRVNYTDDCSTAVTVAAAVVLSVSQRWKAGQFEVVYLGLVTESYSGTDLFSLWVSVCESRKPCYARKSRV